MFLDQVSWGCRQLSAGPETTRSPGLELGLCVARGKLGPFVSWSVNWADNMALMEMVKTECGALIST